MARSGRDLDWKSEYTGVGEQLSDIEWLGDQFLAVGGDGTIISSGGYPNWLLAQGVPPERSDTNDDPNGDGVKNLLAYSAGLPAMGSLSPDDLERVPKIEWDNFRQRWSFGFTQWRELPPGLTYQIEESSDGVDWQVTGSRGMGEEFPQEVQISLPHGFFDDFSRANYPLDFGAQQGLIRLRVER